MSRLSFHKLPAILVILVVSWLSLRLLFPIVLPFLLAALLALAAEPLVLALQRYVHLPRGAAAAMGVTVAMLLSILLLLALCALLVRELGALAGVLPDLESATDLYPAKNQPAMISALMTPETAPSSASSSSRETATSVSSAEIVTSA